MSKKTTSKSKRKKFNDTVKIKLSGKKMYSTASVKYLGVKIDQHLTWQHPINDLSVKLNRANALLINALLLIFRYLGLVIWSLIFPYYGTIA